MTASHKLFLWEVQNRVEDGSRINQSVTMWHSQCFEGVLSGRLKASLLLLQSRHQLVGLSKVYGGGTPRT